MKLPIHTKELEQEELKRLAPYAMKNLHSSGREYLESKDNLRLGFQRDRDRVIHTKSFRRLKGKTQVFVAHYGDHFRSRLTHTLEVAQISRSLARNLKANEDLAETIALAHDLGHTPFGHAGEEAMSELLHRYGMEFEHNAQSRRVVEFLEKKSPNYPGLNLTLETREGLWKHRTPHDRKRHKLSQQAFLEAQIVDIADEIAFQNHDLDDGLRSGILNIKDLEKLDLWKMAHNLFAKNLPEEYEINFTVAGLINLMTKDVLMETTKRLTKLNPSFPDDIRNNPEKVVGFSLEIEEANHHLRHYLFSHFYKNPIVSDQSKKGAETIKQLFFYYIENPTKLPFEYQALIKNGTENIIVIKDFIAGMTDKFAIEEAENIGRK